MPVFLEAYNITMGHEGGYSIDPDDAGGETYKGISRRYNPQWGGWEIIDTMKDHAEFPSVLNKLPQLQDSIHDFYKKYYWDSNKLDEVQDQPIADEMFDTAVNMGRSRAAKFLQETLNYLNRNERLFDDLDVDGHIGPASLRALNYIMENDEEELNENLLNASKYPFNATFFLNLVSFTILVNLLASFWGSGPSYLFE